MRTPSCARELTDGVLHFLSGEIDGGIPTTSQVSDIVAKIVRELGQPTLAQAFAEFHSGADRRNDQGAVSQARRKLATFESVPLGPTPVSANELGVVGL